MMKKIYIPILIILGLIIALALTVKVTRTIDWEESFNEKSNKPYGVSIIYKELERLFEDSKVRTLYHMPDSYFYANSEGGYGDHIAEGVYMKIGNSTSLDFESIDELLLFAERGNTVFISDYYIPSYLTDSLKVDIDYLLNENDSISELSFKHASLQDRNTRIDRNEGDFYFGNFDNETQQVLGYMDNGDRQPNFLKIPYYEGTFYLHLQPKIFTNYNILKEDRFRYVEGVLSYLPSKDIYFDSYLKYQTPYDGAEAEQSSELGWFLEQTAFRWAWYIALLLSLLFIIFNAKRRQRIVAIIKPLQNTTVAFVKTISNLYFETQDHHNLVDKKITYFLEKIRSDFNLNTSVLDEEFIERLSAKSGKKEANVAILINYIKWLQSKEHNSETSLIKLNKFIEEFHSR